MGSVTGIISIQIELGITSGDTHANQLTEIVKLRLRGMDIEFWVA